MAHPDERVAGIADGDPRRQHRQHRAPGDPDGLPDRPDDRRVGRGRLPAGGGLPPAADGPARGGPDLQAHLSRRLRCLHARQRVLRSFANRGVAGRLPGRPGGRGSDDHGDGARDRRADVPRDRARSGPWPERDQRLDRPEPGPGPGRHPHPGRHVAGDLPDQRTDRALRHPLGRPRAAGGAGRPQPILRPPRRHAVGRCPVRPAARAQRRTDVGLDESRDRRALRPPSSSWAWRSWPSSVSRSSR